MATLSFSRPGIESTKLIQKSRLIRMYYLRGIAYRSPKTWVALNEVVFCTERHTKINVLFRGSAIAKSNGSEYGYTYAITGCGRSEKVNMSTKRDVGDVCFYAI